MEYLAHISEERRQSVKEHLCETAELAGKFAESFGKEDWGYFCGMLHDIGKYSLAFQDKILSGSNKMVDHSTAGAKVCWEKGGIYPFMSYCIAGHHAGLPDYGWASDSGSAPTLEGRKKKKIEDYSAYKKEIEIPEIKTPPVDNLQIPNLDFSLSVFIRMLYSCLVDADFLDTERFMSGGEVQRETGEKMEVLLKKLKQHVSGWLSTEETDTINGRRTEILRNCLACGQMEQGRFRLTVPTGGGKTVASLAFALEHAVKNHMDRVIYVIPFTSIIEQNAEVFRQILGDENVLENHCNIDYDSTEELKPMQLASENWDKPVVVTTNVQFFESLFANRPSKCRKLHNIANSVIIFDEVQMLPTNYLKSCVAMIEELERHFRCSIVLCSATQPELTELLDNKVPFYELCPRVPEQFHFFERVSFQTLGIISEEELSERLRKEKQALCIVNTKKSAQKLYKKLQSEDVYHLTTAMYPKHRRRVLEKIRNLLKEGKRCILIATSLVEAGVDLDFNSVYRQLAGVDSMIQAAGRCNREGKRDTKDSFAYIFEFDEKEHVPGQQLSIDVSKMLMKEGKDLFSLTGVESYFQYLYHFRGESLDKHRILEEFKERRYHFAQAAKNFKMIEEDTVNIFVGKEEAAQELLQKIKGQGYTKTGMRKAEQYCVQLFGSDVEKLRGAGMLRPVSEDIEDFFELKDNMQYTEELGLDLEVEQGIALMM